MLRFLARRIRYSLLVLFGVVTLVFFLFNVLPGDPARLTMGQRSDVASLENVRRELNLDKPLFTRYLLYINDLSPISVNKKNAKEKYSYVKLFSVGEDKNLVLKQPYMGRSYRTKREVSSILLDALPGTIILALPVILRPV